MQNSHLITRELINEMLTPEEERAWNTYTAQLPKQELEEAREHLVSAQVITQALVRLMNDGATPESDAVQKLLLQSNQLTLRYRLRERLAVRGQWNENVTRKVHALGMRLVMKTATPDGSVPESRVFDFCCQARKASKWGQALAQRFAGVCEQYSLGDPAIYGRWFIEFGKMLSGNAWVPVDERQRAAWTLLVDAVEASREPAGLRTAAAW